MKNIRRKCLFLLPRIKIGHRIDGNVHCYNENIKKDIIRQKYLEDARLKVIRYTNLDVLYNLDNVLIGIERITPHPNLLPQGEKELRGK